MLETTHLPFGALCLAAGNQINGRLPHPNPNACRAPIQFKPDNYRNQKLRFDKTPLRAAPAVRRGLIDCPRAINDHHRNGQRHVHSSESPHQLSVHRRA